jgi:hypothetical protein
MLATPPHHPGIIQHVGHPEVDRVDEGARFENRRRQIFRVEPRCCVLDVWIEELTEVGIGLIAL